MRVLACLLIPAVLTNAFVAPSFTSKQALTHPFRLEASAKFDNDNIKEANHDESSSNIVRTVGTASRLATMTASLWAATSQMAAAAGPDWGIFEGRTGSLLHPAMMGGLLLYTLYTGFLGFQWRRQRTMGSDITALKETLPDLNGTSTVAEAQALAVQAGDQAQVAVYEAAKSIQSEIDALVAERKELAASGNRDKHFGQGALLAFLGTAFAIEGPLNTYARAGKLFPGPHLYAGAGLVVLWALAVSTVPAMQKGSDTARSIHIGANVAGIGLFGWQVVSGIPILLKVIEKTSWP